MLKKYFRSKLDCNAGEDALCVMLTPSDMQYVDAPMSASMRVICEVLLQLLHIIITTVAKLKFEILDSHIFFQQVAIWIGATWNIRCYNEVFDLTYRWKLEINYFVHNYAFELPGKNNTNLGNQKIT